MGVFVSAFIALSFIAIPEPHLRKAGHEKEKFSHSPWNFRHTVLGVIGIFVYVGIEIGIPGTLNFYLADPTEKVRACLPTVPLSVVLLLPSIGCSC